MKQYLEKRITTKWWNDQEVEKEHLDTLLETVYSTPSKQNCYEWRCIVLTNSDKGKKIKKHLYENHTWVDANLVRAGSADGPRNFNGQYLAPLLFVWVTRFSEIDVDKDIYADERRNPTSRLVHASLNIGICAGAVMTAAEDIGLDTGFGICHDARELSKIMGYDNEHGIVVLGVGYGEKDMYTDSNRVMKNVVVDNKIIGRDLVNIPANVKNTKMRERKPSKDTLIKLV
jgi:nitroreductase